jgi:hypothetical protein
MNNISDHIDTIDHFWWIQIFSSIEIIDDDKQYFLRVGFVDTEFDTGIYMRLWDSEGKFIKGTWLKNWDIFASKGPPSVLKKCIEIGNRFDRLKVFA